MQKGSRTRNFVIVRYWLKSHRGLPVLSLLSTLLFFSAWLGDTEADIPFARDRGLPMRMVILAIALVAIPVGLDDSIRPGRLPASRSLIVMRLTWWILLTSLAAGVMVAGGVDIELPWMWLGLGVLMGAAFYVWRGVLPGSAAALTVGLLAIANFRPNLAEGSNPPWTLAIACWAIGAVAYIIHRDE